MYHLLKQTDRVSYCSRIIDHCLSLKSVTLAKTVHAQLIKVGLNSHTFLGNRYLDLYSKLFDSVDNVLKVFDDISCKNTISWNICLKGMINIGRLESARLLFDEMPERDVVSWNSMISGFASLGYVNSALGTFGKMQNMGVRPSEFTYSIMVSLVSDALLGKELHASMIRSGLSMLNVVLGNSLIDMYGRLGHIDYAFGVFLTMVEVDVITWNSLITGCCKSGYGDLALSQFCLMRSLGFSSDEFTCSAVITSCCNLRNLDKGKQIFAFCLKVGFLCNTIVSSAAIDLFSKCNRLEDSVQLFEELDQRDSALCNSMISSYVGHGFEEKALQIFVDSLRADIRPTEFTISSVLSSISSFPADQGTQIHSLAVKLGLESDAIVASSLVEMYAKFGLIDYAIDIFKNMMIRDLISWNTMIMGLTHNGRVPEALGTFNELLSTGPPPDRMTVAGILLACSYGGFLDEGVSIFSLMHESHGITPGNEHYSCIVDLLCQTGRVDDAMSIVEAMPYEPDSLIWRLILNACAIHGDLRLMEIVAERLLEVEPLLSLPYLVLARIYEKRGQWEAMVRVKRIMEMKKVKTVIGCSWIGLKNNVYVFSADQLQHHGGKNIYSLLRLIDWEVENEGYFCLLKTK
ncbi:pentatricopeptide repeat-containing protein At1g43980, mitochondrial [Mercurialis annua]|uniref:pentatricopeptide repeat-containing protein At1g43980, mitochondrial n=1 Tax=Mercurialis annua TaxID=3986 RepID=UPI00215F5975|nr:pentatricopeptide repeat-containing protein At1g43980, mitochondrial [Mercurialis annua]